MKWILVLAFLTCAVSISNADSTCNKENANKSWKGVGADAVPPGLIQPNEARDAEVTYTCVFKRLGMGFGYVWEATWTTPSGEKVRRAFSEKSQQWGIPLDFH